MSNPSPVTFALLAYNQEEFIREAVEGALSQAGNPLEIILSDDASIDNTFSIMCRMAQAYNGVHRVKLNRNGKNLGLAGHLNHISEIASGDLIIVAAGDDISVPHRAQAIIGRWRDSQGTIGAFHSKYIPIDRSGRALNALDLTRKNCRPNLDEFIEAKGTWFSGTTSAYDRSVFRKFDPLLSMLVHEDRVLPLRALLLGKTIEFIDEPLVKYRAGVGISAKYADRLRIDTRITVLSRLKIDSLQRIIDVQKIDSEDLELKISKRYTKLLCEEKILRSGNLRSIIECARIRGLGSASVTVSKILIFKIIDKWVRKRAKRKVIKY